MIARYSGTCEYFLPTDEMLVVAYKAYSDPGKTYGPPEDCYPPEDDMEILSIRLNGVNYEPSKGRMACIEAACWEDFWQAVSEQDESEYYAELNRGYAKDRA